MNKQPLFAFFGTPHFSVVILEALKEKGLLPALIITAPDKPQGRGLEVTSPPVKKWAQKHAIEIMQPTTLKDESLVQELRNSDWDLFVVAAYAKLLPQTILDIPRRGTLNVHPSLLPKFRGPSPARSAILADERETGVSIMLLSQQMDAGPIVAQAKIELPEEGWPPSGSMLEEILAQEGGVLLAEVVAPWLSGEILPQLQDGSLATNTKKFIDDDARIDIALALKDHRAAREAYLKIKAFDSTPRAHFYASRNGKEMRVVITDARMHDGALEILRVIPEGKREMQFGEFMRSGVML